jgi:hypothetical protein
MQNKDRLIRVDFSLRREVFFVVVGAIVGALVMIIPKTILEVGMGLPYYLTWIAFGHIVGIYSPASIIVGITIHILTAIAIGIISGIILYIGDCACIQDPRTGNPYPPTAQHALRQARVAANNIISVINTADAKKVIFDYKTKGMVALIGHRNGVGILFGHRVHGFIAWWLWRSYYLGNLPTLEKKLRVSVDWFIDLFFKRDVTRLKTLTVERSIEDRAKQREVIG